MRERKNKITITSLSHTRTHTGVRIILTKGNEMPNWCKNNLKIEANGTKVLELLELLKDEKGELTFNKLVPLPDELKDTQAPTPDTVSEEEKQRLIEKYGSTNWYDWRLKNWGVKWDASDSGLYKRDDDWFASFTTPWGPPIEFLKEVSKKFKNITFTLQYADEGIGTPPLGEATFTDGDVWFDGPEDMTKDAEKFASSVWDEDWVN